MLDKIDNIIITDLTIENFNNLILALLNLIKEFLKLIEEYDQLPQVTDKEQTYS
jgi:hypothetical protein